MSLLGASLIFFGGAAAGGAGWGRGGGTGDPDPDPLGDWPNDDTYELTISDTEFERRAYVAEALRTSLVAAEEPVPGLTRNIKVVFTDGSRAIFKEDPAPEADFDADGYLDFRIDYQGWSEVLAAHLNDILGVSRGVGVGQGVFSGCNAVPLWPSRRPLV